MVDQPTYQVAISFAGEQRAFASNLAKQLHMRGVQVFYDEFHLADLWGKDLSEELHRVYSKDANFVLMLISDAYCKKQWTRHERRAALEKAIAIRSEYILPIRFDDSWPEGISQNIHYLSALELSEAEIATLLCKKLGVVAPDKASDVPAPQLTSLMADADFDYTSYDGRYAIGDGDAYFETKWSEGGSTSIRAYNDPPSINGIAVARDAKSLADITDASIYDFTARARIVHVGEYLILRNRAQFYAALKITGVAHRQRGSSHDRLSFFYIILRDGSTNFSEYSALE